MIRLTTCPAARANFSSAQPPKSELDVGAEDRHVPGSCPGFSRLARLAGLGFVLLVLFIAIPVFATTDPAHNGSRYDGKSPIVDPNTVFEEVDGMVAVEAEHFVSQSLTDQRAFYLTHAKSDYGHSNDDPNHADSASGGAYLEILPDTRRTHADKLIPGQNFSNQPGKLAVLNYLVHFNNPGKYYVWVRAFSTGSEDNGLHVGLDGQWPPSGQRLQWCSGKQQWWWESKQRTQEKHCGVPHQIFLEIKKPGVHTVSFSMREDGFEFDRFLLTRDRKFSRPADAGPATRVKQGQLPKEFPVVAVVAKPKSNPIKILGEPRRWHRVTLECTGPQSGEDATPNPFRDYRLSATFRHAASGKQYVVPGCFVADGKAADTAATSGNKWHVHFAPDEIGRWEYSLSFRTGNYIAVSESSKAGKPLPILDGKKGYFEIEETDKQGDDFRARGRLSYVGEHYLRFEGTGEYFLKCGADAPENLLAYVDFDGDFKTDKQGDQFLKTWAPHVDDWQTGDPTWGDGKGKGLIGAVNYLASKKMNAMSFLTMNILGDDKNVFPYTSYSERQRFDVSRLAQWDKVFAHAQQKGIFLHFKTQEAENQGLLDGGGVGVDRKLYYRELIARFGYHLALNWNLGEENGEWAEHVTLGQDTPNRKLMAQYFYDHDPYRHLVVIHNGVQFDDLLGDQSTLTGASVQTNRKDFGNVHGAVLRWRRQSANAGKRWVVSCDEPGDAQFSLVPDAINPDHDNARINALWGTLMAGGAGVEWYFGYKHAHSDLSCQDWRSREKMWDQSRLALDLFAGRIDGIDRVPFEKMQPKDRLVAGDSKQHFCFYQPGNLWLVYFKKSKKETDRKVRLDLEGGSGEVSVTWFNSRTGEVKKGAEPLRPSNGKLALTAPDQQDWLAVVRSLSR